jgi:hypothetical protein
MTRPAASRASYPAGVATIGDCLATALGTFDLLAGRAEAVDDEWQYVTDLGTVWRARLRAVTEARGGEPATPEQAAAIAALAAEAGGIEDAHRAIDWLSTLPQVALAAIGEPA